MQLSGAQDFELISIFIFFLEQKFLDISGHCRLVSFVSIGNSRAAAGGFIFGIVGAINDVINNCHSAAVSFIKDGV